MSTRVSRRAYYSGRVQGVGFRYSVKRIAAGFEVIGWVRNLADGRVEMEATADPVELDAFLESIRRSHLATHIRQVEHIVVEPPANDVTGFEITH